jgi:hypothetical protein
MHYNVLIILNPPLPNLRERVDEVMRPFKLDWDDEVSCRTARWDWCSLPADGPFRDPDAGGSANGFEPLNRVCRLSHLPPDYLVSAAITPDGTWHDLADFGYRLIDEDSPRNEEALARW